ncbi:MAG: VOC family protein, partial [Saprospiraceae bacterium]
MEQSNETATKRQKVTTFLTFNNQAGEAMHFYVSVFKNARILSASHYGGNSPVNIMTGTFQIDGQNFMVLNGGPHFKFAPGVSLFVHCETQEEVDDL